MQYKKLDSISHILHRPDMYIGTNQNTKEDLFLYDETTEKLQYTKNVVMNDGILRCFTEVISNAIDNFFRSRDSSKTPMTKLQVKYNEEQNMIEIANDGNHIPVEIHPEEKIYIPELIFGHLLSGSNYNDKDESRIVSGRNGLGVKLLNVFSKEFKIECYDIDKKLVYKQTWKDNMRVCKPPRITEKTSSTVTSGYTKISFKLDLSKFLTLQKTPMEDTAVLDQSLIAAFQKLLVDSSLIMGIPVTWNKQKFNVKKISDYAKLVSSNFDKKYCIEGQVQDSQLEYCIIPFDSAVEHISFVNGIYTKEGGIHVETFYQKLFQPLLLKLKKFDISMKELKKHFTIVIKVFVANPVFSSQSKTKLISSKTDLTKLIQLDDKITSKIMKWEFLNRIKEDFDLKQELSLKKTEKKRGFKKIDGYDKANLSSGKRSQECSLILCEGLSAKTFATKGISKGLGSKKGRDFFGIYPLRGKVLNVRNSTSASISTNREITDIIHCMNLKFGVDYTQDKNFETLSYGQIIILTDADVDGMHICGLLLNVFHKLFPSLLQREEPFIRYMMTPIAKMKIGSETLTFYNDFEYQQKLQQVEHSKRKFEVKYYKGLGTSNDAEIKDTFGEKVVNMVSDEQTNQNMNLVFHKNLTTERKDWLLTIDESNYQVPQKNYPISSFFNQDFIKFSIDDCKRSIPSIFDGLKNSQRKILYSVFKKNLQYQHKSLKVAQLAAFTAECSLYHHGEQNLSDTIVKLAQDYVGSNNIPLLFPDGQFGSRIENGKDSASSRYIYTKLAPLTNLLFPDEDNALLKYTYDDGVLVEPEFYIPLVPLILINGCRAIATGWSSFIPNFHVKDVIQKLFFLLDEDQTAFDQHTMLPYYHGFQGTIEKVDNQNKFVTKGVLETKPLKNKTVYIVKEIPIGESIEGYKSYCEKLMEDKIITNFKNYSSDSKVHFEFQKHDTYHKKEFNLETLKLTSNLSLNNMVLFTKKDLIRKYDTIDEIIVEFFEERIHLFEKRIEHMLECLKKKKTVLQNKSNFLLKVVEQSITLFNRSNSEIQAQLESFKFKKMENSYDYLLTMPIRSMTKERYHQLCQEITSVSNEIKNLEKMTAKEMWKKELENLEKQYEKYF